MTNLPRSPYLPSLRKYLGERAIKTSLLVVVGLSAISGHLSALSAESITGAKLTAGPIQFPADFMTSVKTYGAVGDGKTDDTKAIQAALSDGRTNPTSDYNGLPKALYFPPGTYLVSDTLTWNGCCVTLQGDGTATSVIRLAPNTAGYGNSAAPKSVVQTAATNTNESFHQNIWDLGISVGAGNPGAIALTYVSNNVGSVHDVSIVSEDGQGVTGLDLTHRYPGPMMVKNVSIHGFQKGIDTCSCFEYSATFEGLTLSGQSLVGINDWDEPLYIRNLLSSNQVPVLIDRSAASEVIDAKMTGGSGSTQAIVNNSALYLRNVSSAGYGATLSDASQPAVRTIKGTITEFSSLQPVHLKSTTATGSLKLAVEETPIFNTSELSDWMPYVPRWYGDTGPLQATFDSGKSTIYFPSGRYFAYNQATITVPDSVKEIVGFGSIVNGSTGGTSGGGYLLVVDSDSSEPLIIEQFNYGMKIEHRGTRPVVLKDGTYTYTSTAGAGNLFLEDVGTRQLTFQASQHVWARQLDDEVATTKITNNGTLWIFGLKTEQGNTVIQTNAEAKTELLGGLIYPAKAVPDTDVAFTSINAATSYIYRQSMYCASCGYANQIKVTQDGSTQLLTSKATAHYTMPLFIEEY